MLWFIKSGENTLQLAAGMNRGVGWQATSLGVAKRIQEAKVLEFALQIPSACGGVIHSGIRRMFRDIFSCCVKSWLDIGMSVAL